MINFFINWYSLIRIGNKYLKKLKIYGLHEFIVFNLANILLPIYFKLTQSNKNHKLKTKESTSPKIIVSLTSFPARISALWIVIETILRQTIKPDVIILWLSKEQFADLDILPQNLIKLQKRGLIIELRDDDLRSHKKYYYAFSEYPNDIVITLDDDIFYNTKTIEKLIYYHKEHTESVIANHTHQLEYDEENNLKPYVCWSNDYDNSSNRNVQIGIGGVLYPPKLLYKDVLNKSIALELSKYADDLWLFAMTRLNDKKVIKTDFDKVFLHIRIKNNKTLSSVNVNENMNDLQSKNIREYYVKNLNIDPFEM